MRQLFILIILFWVGFTAAQNKISVNVDAIPLQEVIRDLEQQTSYRFYYRIEDVQGKVVSSNFSSESIDEVLKAILQNTGLTFSKLREKQVYISHTAILPSTFDGGFMTFQNQAGVSEEQELTASEQKYLSGRKPTAREVLTVGSKNSAANASFVNIRVTMMNAENGEPLIGASMYLEETQKGAATDLNGNLVISLEPSKKYSVKFSCLGMQEKTVSLIPYNNGNLSVELNPAVIAINEVTVKAEQQQRLQGVNIGMEKLSMKSMKELPSFMGEKDVIKISQFLPGVQTVGEGSSGVYIRGGNADQNLFYMNSVPVYNTSHLFGFFSAFNSTMIKDFTLYKGHLPAEYGGRLSSVFEINSRNGNQKHFSARGGISPVSADLLVEGPIKQDKATFVLSGRSSYSDWILQRLDDPTLRNSKAGFYDLAGLVNYEVSDKSRVKLFLYGSRDNFTMGGYSDYNYGNTGGSVTYDHYFTPAFAMNVTAALAAYNFEINEYSEAATAYHHDYQVGHNELNVGFKYFKGPKHQFDFGFNNTFYNLDRGVVEPFNEESIRSTLDLGKESGLESGIYFGDLYTPNNWLSIYGGLRFNNFMAFGPRVVNIYSPDSPREPDYVIDTKEYGSGSVVKDYQSPELRLSLNMRPGSLTSVKLAYNQTSQNLFMLSNTVAIAPNDQWKLADSYIKPARAQQVSLGLFQELPGLGLSTSVEVYGKKAKNIVEYRDGVDFIGSADVETMVLQGDQDAYGLEFILRKNTGRFTGWVSYTYSRSLMQVNGDNEWDQINKGELYPSNFDIPHSANAIINYKFNRRVSFSSNLVYKTGRPVTYPQSIYYVEDRQVIDYSDRNAYRIPDYMRVDASLTIDGNLKRDKFMHHTWMFSVYNATGRKNAYSVYFRMDDGVVKGYKYSVIGVPIFTVKWIFKLGNYAAD